MARAPACAGQPGRARFELDFRGPGAAASWRLDSEATAENAKLFLSAAESVLTLHLPGVWSLLLRSRILQENLI